MNTEAGEALKSRYAASAPHRQNASIAREDEPPHRSTMIPMLRKKGTQVPAASPSSPSVRLTQLTAERNTNTASGNIHHPMSKLLFQKGTCRTVSPGAHAVQPGKYGGEGLEKRFLPGAQPQIFPPALFEKIVEKTDEKISEPDGERDDRRAVRPAQKDALGEHRG